MVRDRLWTPGRPPSKATRLHALPSNLFNADSKAVGQTWCSTYTDWARCIRGIRCNASRKSHAELDESETLDDGDPVELGGQYKAIKAKMPWLNIFGGCCGSDLRHVTQIARAIAA